MTNSSQPQSGAQQLKARLDMIAEAGSSGQLRARLAAKWPAFSRENLRQIIIVGAAGEGARLAKICAEQQIAVRGIADDNPAMHGATMEGIEVKPTASLKGLDTSIPVVIASHRALLPVRKLREMGFAYVTPFLTLQAIDPERFPPHMFHEGLLEDLFSNLDKYRELATILADDHSKAALAAVIGYRMDGEPEVLNPIVEWDLYGPANLLNYSSNEVYVDGGTFDGDSIRLFIERVGNQYVRIIGFEPDPGTFARLKANFAGEPRVEPINAGLHKAKGTLRFDNAGTRGSILVESGGVTVPVVALDDVLNGDRVSYIKMNIEGAEIAALHGGSKSIKRWKPKLAISAYHLPDHLWRVPQTIRELDPDYRILFRQHDGGIIETVVFALPDSPSPAS